MAHPATKPTFTSLQREASTLVQLLSRLANRQTEDSPIVQEWISTNGQCIVNAITSLQEVLNRLPTTFPSPRRPTQRPRSVIITSTLPQYPKLPTSGEIPGVEPLPKVSSAIPPSEVEPQVKPLSGITSISTLAPQVEPLPEVSLMVAPPKLGPQVEYKLPRLVKGMVMVIRSSDPEFKNVLSTTSAGRVGVIPYVRKDNGLWVLLGIKPTGKYTDFGGGCKKGYSPETMIRCGMREFNEETNGSAIKIPKFDQLTVFIIGTGGNPWVTMLYDYSSHSAEAINFKRNEELVSADWYKMDDVYKYPQDNDAGLAYFVRFVPQDMLKILKG